MKIIVPILVIFLISCWVLTPNPPLKHKDFKYYNPSFKLSDNSILRTDGFYFVQEEDSIYDYLRFYTDGRINTRFTSGKPSEMRESYWPFNDVYGYYTIKGDSIWFTVKSVYKVYESWKGYIEKDKLKLEVMIYTQNIKGKHIRQYEYMFHDFAVDK